MKTCNRCGVPLTAETLLVDRGPKASKSGVKPYCRVCNAKGLKQQRADKKAGLDVRSLLSKVDVRAQRNVVPLDPDPTPDWNGNLYDSSPAPKITAPSAESRQHVEGNHYADLAAADARVQYAKYLIDVQNTHREFKDRPTIMDATPPAAAVVSNPKIAPVLERILIIPDCHHPAAHSDYRVMLRAAMQFQPDGIIILGDFADAESLSAHPKTEKGATDFAEEVTAVNAELDILDALPGVKWKKYIEGNHEWRLQRYLANNASALMGMLNIQQCFHLHERGWAFTPYMSPTRVGKIHFTHDTGQAGVNAHRSARDIFMGSAVIGHTHRMAYEVRGVWDGSPVVTAMFGWLGDPEQITYVHQAAAAQWPRGFGIGYHDTSTGLMYMTPVPIVNGTCVIEGKLIK